MKIKNLILTTISGLLVLGALGLSINTVSSQYSPTNQPFYETSRVGVNEDTLEIGQNIATTQLDSTSDGAFAQIRDLFGLGNYRNEDQPAIVYIKNIVNLLLGLVSFISLIIVISAFYLIFFSKQEEGVAKAKKMLIGVAIALAVMGLSRLITSYFYNVYSIATGAI